MKNTSQILLYILIICIVTENIHAQAKPEKKIKFPFRNFTIDGMYSYHSKQSLGGYVFAFGNEIKIKSRLFYSNNLAFTVHSGVDPKNNMPAQMMVSGPTTGPLRFTTGGLQYSPSIKYEIIPNRLKIVGGGLVRYQTTSWPDRYSFFSAETTPLIVPAHYEIYEIHPHTMAVGLRFTTDIELVHQNKYDIHLSGFMQKDTNKDVIQGVGIVMLMHYLKSK